MVRETALAAVLLAFGGFAGTTTAGARVLSRAELRHEMRDNSALAAYVCRNGYPAVAEVRRVTDPPPWDNREVVLYYPETRKVVGFARAFVLGRPEVHLERFERPLAPGELRQLEGRARRQGASPLGRARAALARAERAAARIEPALNRAERAAARAEAAAAKLERSFTRELEK